MTELKFNSEGLIPAIVQDADTNEVLMMAYMNEESFRLTKETGLTHFYSRSRQKLWKKGETSGHVQKVVSIQLDCDADTLLVRVRQEGVACHLDRMSCFEEVIYGDVDGTMAIIPELSRVIRDRKLHPKEGSYTNKLLDDEDKRLKKVVEEAAETVLAFKGGDRKAMAWELADLLYHLMVMLEASDMRMEDVYRKLSERRR
ncbi:MAG: bifunctional phosphoribosyl-AMP cyclohydrolase/phosphoribosyl-ATP diphosphatase HisIE [Methanomassiliicoccales archaeon]|nr:MAG: bifunctional phosphoribosyl-AMP cyclohydrolase/phosphoribosyl-ATP diphosphatase HisIE [Methanomassiliicoccales archaeon]